MTSYRIEVSATAERQLKALHTQDQVRIIRAIQALRTEPYPRGNRKLSGYRDVFRIRVGRYRVLYSVDKKNIVVIVLKLGHRKQVYR